MIEIVGRDICRYYGDTKSINDLEGASGANRRECPQIGISADQPHPIEVRRALKAWAADKPPAVRNLAGTVCQLMWMSERYPHSKAVRAVLAANLARLESLQVEGVSRG